MLSLKVLFGNSTNEFKTTDITKQDRSQLIFF